MARPHTTELRHSVLSIEQGPRLVYSLRQLPVQIKWSGSGLVLRHREASTWELFLKGLAFRSFSGQAQGAPKDRPRLVRRNMDNISDEREREILNSGSIQADQLLRQPNIDLSCKANIDLISAFQV